VNERYQRIQAMEKEYLLSDLCAALAVSRSGYYAWRDRLREEIEELRRGPEAAYGSPRMTVELQSRGYACSENRVARLMRRHGWRAQVRPRFVPLHHRQRPRRTDRAQPPGPTRCTQRSQ
jgi:transposase InsO family protein